MESPAIIVGLLLVKFTAPKNRGCMIVFDSRTIHRVTNIESGIRKSLVGWVLGPRWK